MQLSLVHNLKTSVERYAGNVVLIQAQEQLTYAELWRQTIRIARSLAAVGVGRGDRVAILLDNSTVYVSSYYGILLAGGVVVALNAGTKAKDILNWIKHSGALCLVTSSRHPEYTNIVAQTERDLVIFDVDGTLSDKHSDARIRSKEEYIDNSADTTSEYILPVYHENDAATVIYTSGTTGNPKGVTLSHRNLVSNVESILQYLSLTNTDRLMNVLPFYYSYGNSVLHTHIAVGGSLVLQNSLAYPHLILKQIQETRATGFSGVPSTYSLLLSRTKLREHDLSSLRYMTQAGGPMAPNLIKELVETLPHVKFFVMYGQTEATARLSYLPPEKLVTKLGSIGMPIPGVKIEIRDEHEELVSADVTGEIYASGENVMLGYWNDPDTTSKVLRNGWLKTGDLAYMDQDGFIYIVGRHSDMIKSGAHRISPKEIEEVIMEIDGIAEVAVVGVKDDLLGQVIKAVIVPRVDQALSEMKIKAHCKERLATYKIPKFIEFVQELPKTASGKVKRFLLTE